MAVGCIQKIRQVDAARTSPVSGAVPEFSAQSAGLTKAQMQDSGERPLRPDWTSQTVSEPGFHQQHGDDVRPIIETSEKFRRPVSACHLTDHETRQQRESERLRQELAASSCQGTAFRQEVHSRSSNCRLLGVFTPVSGRFCRCTAYAAGKPGDNSKSLTARLQTEGTGCRIRGGHCTATSRPVPGRPVGTLSHSSNRRSTLCVWASLAELLIRYIMDTCWRPRPVGKPCGWIRYDSSPPPRHPTNPTSAPPMVMPEPT